MTRKEVYAELLRTIENLNKISFAAAARHNTLDLTTEEKQHIINATQQIKVATARMETNGNWR